ncbi:efflux RND transporter periplasmic adaptor subunit [Dongia rigui]|uniref:Efflux RND transporter periplasmic adaptor subunit n=1 Tax=Dongia rigui TaxID=940149 RepID=A0ABU5E390_9PROT|nr:efflux RND transporter periplasmic adaptor subunit [Dongia rigui]MDY0873664.1 efflux RND transporter periplasmic adaptor subunit [Dongia rigui]
MTDPTSTSEPAAISAPHTPPRHSPRWIIGILCLGAVVFGGGYYFFQHYQGSMTPAAAAAPAAPPPVTVAKPLVKEITEWDEFTGQFAAVDSVEIRARVSGYLESIHFTDGQMVKEGDLLFVVDPRPFEITLTSAQAALNSAQARFDLAKQQLARADKLKKSDFVSQSTFDERQQEMLSAAADAEVAKAAIASAKLNLSFTRVLAPMSGRIGNHQVSVGNLITGGDGGDAMALATIVSLDPIHLNFDVSEQDFLAYQRAAASGRLTSARDQKLKVSAHLTDEKDWPLQGTMDFVNNEVDRTTGTIRARAVFPNEKLLITPGQFGRVRIPGSDPYDAVLIPDSAILSDQSQKIVMTVAGDGTVAPRVIRPGPLIDGLRVVREGLTGDDQIVIDGLLRARPGAKVAPTVGKIDAKPEN